MIFKPLFLLIISNAAASIGTGVAMIAIPWMLVSQNNGAATFGILATIVNIGLFFGTPFIGPLIDKNSRKALMLLLRIIFIIGLMIVIAINYAAFSHFETIGLIIYYVLGSTFYAFNIPLRSAFVQQLFEPSEYLRVNSILEIENQVAAVITGVIAIAIIELYGLNILALLNIAAYLIAIICISYIPSSDPSQKNTSQNSILIMLKDGFELSFRSADVTSLLIASTFPYIVVILYTVLHPIALAELPQATASTYALVELLFGLGAILGGIIINRWDIPSSRLASHTIWMIFAFSAVATIQAFFQTYAGFILLAAAFGFTNASTRVLRQSILMHEFDQTEVGRIGAFLQIWIMFARAIFIAAMTALIGSGNSAPGVWFAASVACLPALILAVRNFFYRNITTKGNL